MENAVYNLEQIKAAIRSINDERSALIYNAAVNNPFQVQSYTLDLTTARDVSNPFIINFPFKCIAFKSATDLSTNVDVKFNSFDSGLSSVNFKDNDNLSSDVMFDSAYITHSAQSGKSIVVYIFVSSKFTSGSFLNSGTVTVSNPTTLVGPTRVVLSAATATIIAPATTARRQATIQNKTGASLYVGDSTVTNSGATEGIEMVNGAVMYYANTAALYGYSVAGGNVNRLEET